MSKLVLAALCLGALPLLAAAETWTDVPLIDQNCSTKYNFKTADTHTRSCALSCASSGYGILTSSGTYLKFDKSGSQKVLKELKASSKKDHIRATVTGDQEGSSIKVQSVKLD
ncbi:MAG: hypothetical protein IT160_12645 [Bryobacterales bacterium]|nr:hypothetical protein [Bryobacterales bacterium]